MKIPCLCSFVVLSATAAFAQTSAAPVTPAVSSDTSRTVAVTGCVAGGDKSESITLRHAMVLPFGSPAVVPEPISAAEPPVAVSPDPAPVSAGATQPRPAQPPAPAPAASPVPRAVGTSGTISGTAPAGSSASSVDGYRLSGVDMTAWIGRRVQLLGTVVPPAALTQAVGVETSERVALAAMPEFRVMSVQPVTGPCPK